MQMYNDFIQHNLKMLNRNEIKVLLKQVHAGNLSKLQEFKLQHPDVHWKDVKYQETGDTLLHIVARLGYIEFVHFLLAEYDKTPINCRNNDNKTALHEAAQFAQHKVVELLIENGCDVNALKKADWTPLMLACTKIQQPDSLLTVNALLKHKAVVNYSNKDGWNCLHLIAREGDVEIMKLLIEHGVNVDQHTKNGRTALHIAALHANKTIINELMSLNGDINATDNCGNTILHEATLSGDLSTLETVLAYKPNLYVGNNMGFTILHLAASCGNDIIINYIVNQLNFDVNTSMLPKYLTALHCAARKQYVSAYKMLIALGCDIDRMDGDGRKACDYLEITRLENK